jgi:two-component system, OmpR family, KDP operon response regulator KdpE
MTGARILVVDDEPQIRRALEVALEDKGYQVRAASTAEEAGDLVRTWRPDLLIVDLVLPGQDGLALTRKIREQSTSPIIVLSALGDERKKVEALEQGADDYVTKPFGVPELLARLKSLLRRSAGSRQLEPIFETGELSVSFDRREVRLAGAQVKLTPTEYDLLKYLIQNAGKVLTHRMLLTAVWGPQHARDAQYLRVFVGQLRKKLEKEPARPRYILTDPGVGYRFELAPSAE